MGRFKKNQGKNHKQEKQKERQEKRLEKRKQKQKMKRAERKRIFSGNICEEGDDVMRVEGRPAHIVSAKDVQEDEPHYLLEAGYPCPILKRQVMNLLPENLIIDSILKNME